MEEDNYIWIKRSLFSNDMIKIHLKPPHLCNNELAFLGYQENKECKRVFSDNDPYGEETWED